MTCSRAPFDATTWHNSVNSFAKPAAVRRRGAECVDSDVLLGSLDCVGLISSKFLELYKAFQFTAFGMMD